MKTEARCFFIVEDVLFIDEASDGAYDGGAVYVGVEELDVCAAEVPVCDALVEDMLVVCWFARLLLGNWVDSDNVIEEEGFMLA